MTKSRFLLVYGGGALAVGVICLLVGWLASVVSLMALGWLASGVGMAWLVGARFASKEPMRTYQQRYMREFFPAIAAYTLIMLLVWPLLKHVHATPARLAIALLPVVPLALVVRAFVRMVMHSDELEQRLHLIGLSISSALVVLLSITGGFLAAAKVVPLDGTALFWVFPVMMVGFAAARWWAARHYGVKGGCP